MTGHSMRLYVASALYESTLLLYPAYCVPLAYCPNAAV
jgi:hypothetical protein